jgi:hypothetical protein
MLYTTSALLIRHGFGFVKVSTETIHGHRLSTLRRDGSMRLEKRGVLSGHRGDREGVKKWVFHNFGPKGWAAFRNF